MTHMVSTGGRGRPGIVLAAILATAPLAGCRSTGAWSPAESSRFERLAVTSTSRSGGAGSLEFGEYRADALDRGWARGRGSERRGGRTATRTIDAEQEYGFTLSRAGMPRTLVACHAAGSRGGVAIGSVEIEGAARLTLQCSLTDVDGEGRWRLQLDGPGEHAMQGWLTNGKDRFTVTADRHGSKLLPQGARGYRLRSADGEVMAVDVREGAVWLRQTALERVPDVLAAAATALLLFDSPLPDA